METIIRNWSNSCITQNSGKISLDAGQKISITLKFYENTGEAVAKLSWSYADQGKTTIPQSQLFPEDYTKVTGVSVESTKQVNEGLTVQLTATVDPSDATYKNLLWTSADTTIATVDGTGLVTGVKKREVTITVRTIDGGETATCQVTVVDITKQFKLKWK